MNALRRLTVVTLLAVWCFPAASLARPRPAPAAVAPGPPSRTPAAAPATREEACRYRAREGQSQDLQDFRGGAVAIYIGGGAVMVILLIVLLLILI